MLHDSVFNWPGVPVERTAVGDISGKLGYLMISLVELISGLGPINFLKRERKLPSELRYVPLLEQHGPPNTG